MSVNSTKNIDFILSFVVRYDIPFKYDQAIGKLWQEGCFEEPERTTESSIVRLAEFVGACYCAMIREDVHHRLPEGLQLFRRSRRAWNILNDNLNSNESNAIDEAKHRYILARWKDAVGRIFYRTGNYTLARITFSEALYVAAYPSTPRHHSCEATDFEFLPYWCWTDIKSNLERTKFEITRQSGDDKARKAREVREELEVCIEWSRTVTKCELDEARKKEVLRGIVSCLHNWLSCGFSDASNKNQAMYEKEIDEILSNSCSDDIYRRAQILTTKAQTFIAKARNTAANSDAEKRSENLSEARKIYHKLKQLPWPRGRFFSIQNIAYIDGDGEKLIQLCEKIEEDIIGSGGLDAVDIDIYDWTLNLAEEILQKNQNPEEIQRSYESLRKQQIAITRVVSGIVSVATYRQKFEKKIRPRLRSMALEEVSKWSRKKESSPENAQEELDNLVDTLEEFSYKEVLEVLRSKNLQSKQEINTEDGQKVDHEKIRNFVIEDSKSDA